MIVHLEYLYHYTCDHCKGYWTIADRQPVIGVIMTCPDPACGQSSVVEMIQAHSLNPIEKAIAPNG